VRRSLLTAIIGTAAVITAVVLLSSCSKSQSLDSFNKDTAYTLLKKQVAYGPRVPGTKAQTDCLAFLTSELSKSADKVLIQRFRQDVGDKIIPLVNVIGLTNPTAKRQILLAAHWDSRPMADQEVIAEKRNSPIPGANDGASGVAVLLELSRVFASHNPDVGVITVFFDGEDYGSTDRTMYLGARYFAKTMNTVLAYKNSKLKPESGILLDMIGDSDLDIYKERNSVDADPKLVDAIWKTAADLGYSKHFKNSEKYAITDDHLPLIDAGLPCIDIIDFDYAYWHTTADTPDKCSPESLKIVGDVIAAYVYSLKSPDK